MRYLGTLVLAMICGFALAVSAALAQEQGAKDLYGKVDQLVRTKGTEVTFEFSVPVKVPGKKDPDWESRTFVGSEATIKGVRVASTDSFVLLRFADKELQKDDKGRPKGEREITVYMADYGRDGFVDRTVQVALTADQISAEADDSMEDDCASPEWEDPEEMETVISMSGMAIGTSNTAIAGEMSEEEKQFNLREIRYVYCESGAVLMLKPPSNLKTTTVPVKKGFPGEAPNQQAKFRGKLEEFLSE